MKLLETISGSADIKLNRLFWLRQEWTFWNTWTLFKLWTLASFETYFGTAQTMHMLNIGTLDCAIWRMERFSTMRRRMRAILIALASAPPL